MIYLIVWGYFIVVLDVYGLGENLFIIKLLEFINIEDWFVEIYLGEK